MYLIGNDSELRLDMTRFELAEYLNLPRPSLSRELAAMKDEGVLDFLPDGFVIKNLELLKVYVYG